MRIEWEAHAEVETENALSVAYINHLCELVGAPLDAEFTGDDRDRLV